MNIYLTESEYDAISFAWSQITTEIEGCSDDSFVIEAGEAISQLSSIQDKYREAKRKSQARTKTNGIQPKNKADNFRQL